jgi:hypothetical protein
MMEKPKTFEELEAELGENLEEEDKVPKRFEFIEDLEMKAASDELEASRSPQLDLNEISELAHNNVARYRKMMWPDKEFPLYEDLSDEDKDELKRETFSIMEVASKIDIMEFAKAKHAQKAMSLLAQGVNFGMEETEKTSPIVMPWDYMPNEYRMPFFLYLETVKRLVVSVWNGQ